MIEDLSGRNLMVPLLLSSLPYRVPLVSRHSFSSLMARAAGSDEWNEERANA